MRITALLVALALCGGITAAQARSRDRDALPFGVELPPASEEQQAPPSSGRGPLQVIEALRHRDADRGPVERREASPERRYYLPDTLVRERNRDYDRRRDRGYEREPGRGYDRNYESDRGTRDERDDPRMSPSEAAGIATAQHGGGRVLSVQLSGDGRSYRVKLLKQGEVRVVEVPAR